MNALAIGLLVMLTAGCKNDDAPNVQEGVIVKGRIVSGENPMTAENAPPGGGSGQVSLVPAEEQSADGGNSGYATAMVDDQGYFEFLGDGKGVSPGKYRLAVAPADAAGVPGGTRVPTNRNPVAQVFSVKNTPIEVTIPGEKVGGEHDLGTIDLAKYLKK